MIRSVNWGSPLSGEGGGGATSVVYSLGPVVAESSRQLTCADRDSHWRGFPSVWCTWACLSNVGNFVSDLSKFRCLLGQSTFPHPWDACYQRREKFPSVTLRNKPKIKNMPSVNVESCARSCQQVWSCYRGRCWPQVIHTSDQTKQTWSHSHMAMLCPFTLFCGFLSSCCQLGICSRRVVDKGSPLLSVTCLDSCNWADL